jgi:2-polyprenyl-3-methyl-5-hydroxy-6-metoxy-1,4-benzoquinol methylase
MNYKANFTNFVKKCDEKKKEADTLRKILKNKKRGSLLDVGGGNGYLSIALDDLFEEITVIEKNPMFKINHVNYRAKVFYAPIESIDIKTKFDVIIASHVFPYIKDQKKQFVLNKLKMLLKNNGFLIIIEMAKSGEIGFIKEMILRDKLISTHQIVTDLLKKQNTNYYETSIKPKITTSSAKELIKIIQFFTEKYNGHYEKSRENIIKYINNNLYIKEKNTYELNYVNKILVIRK